MTGTCCSERTPAIFTRSAVPKFYFEDFSPGWTVEFGPRRVTREEMIGFAAQFDPQPMHLDEEAARHTMLGGLAASGWHTCSVMMKMIADGVLLDSASMGAPGIEEVKWLKPVRPGDSLTDRGFVSFFWEVFNDRGQQVMTLACPQMLLRRNAGAPA